MNQKPFKTHNQQLVILRSRGLIVPSEAKRSLEQIGYYSIINGYKWLFLQRDSNGNVIHPEKYIKGAQFSDIQNLYDFDDELRSILYNSLLKYESILGAELSYRFSEAHEEEHAYLAMDNFDRNPKNMATVVRTISSLSNTLKKESGKRDSNAIKHYVNQHGHVPLWVLVNFLTFGDLNYFYKNMTRDTKIQVAKDFTLLKKRTYHLKQQHAITPDIIESINHLVNHFRNAVAHGEITFSKKINKPSVLTSFKTVLNEPNLKFSSQAGVFELIISLKIVLPKKEYSKLSRKIKGLLNEYQNKFSSVPFSAVLQDMNFPKQYALYI